MSERPEKRNMQTHETREGTMQKTNFLELVCSLLRDMFGRIGLNVSYALKQRDDVGHGFFLR